MATRRSADMLPDMNAIYARARLRDSEQVDSELIAAIVAKVRVPVPMRDALAAWRGLQRRHAELSDSLRSAIAELHAAGGDGANGAGRLVARVHQLNTELRAVA